MTNRNADISNHKPGALLAWLGAAGVGSLLMLALMMGRYAQRVDEIAEDVEVIRAATLENQKTLAQVSMMQAVQAETDNAMDSRIARLEAKK